MHKCWVPIFLICIFLLCPAVLFADSPRKLVDKGNTAYLTGKYDEAIDAYEEASVDEPESARIYFNKGAAFYKKEDYKAAKAAFEKAALKSDEVVFEAKAKFNLGNCEFREAERIMDSELKKALETCGKSIRYYQEALELDPLLSEAAENIEIVRLVMKTILDEIKKQEEAEKQKQAAADKIKELIEKQQNLLDTGKQVSESLKKEEADGDVLDQIADLAEGQNDLETETRDLAKAMETQQQSQQQQNPLAPPHPSIEHLENAAKEESDAAEKLDVANVEAAQPNQETALEELKKALAAMNQDKDGQCQKKGGDQQQQQQQQQQQAQQSQEKPSKEDQDKKEQEAMAQLPDDAKDILDEEKENKKKRRMPASSGYRRVDRDW
ncbi:MAG: tetratricopeptide repeat protein [Desulfobacterales bacterium]|nr:tetratricopeptide repeat protein [Desulfobacterales bacterium]